MAHNCMTFSQIIMMTRIRVTHSRPVPSRAILRCRRRGGSQLPPTLYRIAVWFMGHVRECLPDVLILCLFTAPLQPRPWTFLSLSKSVKSRSLSSPIKWTHGSKTNNQNSPPKPSSRSFLFDGIISSPQVHDHDRAFTQLLTADGT